MGRGKREPIIVWHGDQKWTKVDREVQFSLQKRSRTGCSFRSLALMIPIKLYCTTTEFRLFCTNEIRGHRQVSATDSPYSPVKNGTASHSPSSLKHYIASTSVITYGLLHDYRLSEIHTRSSFIDQKWKLSLSQNWTRVLSVQYWLHDKWVTYVLLQQTTQIDSWQRCTDLCCLSITILVVLILAYGIHTGIESGYSPTAAGFCMPGVIVNIVHPKTCPPGH